MLIIPSSHDCSRLRLAAACGIMKIAQELHYDEVIALEHFQQLALTLQVYGSYHYSNAQNNTLLLLKINLIQNVSIF